MGSEQTYGKQAFPGVLTAVSNKSTKDVENACKVAYVTSCTPKKLELTKISKLKLTSQYLVGILTSDRIVSKMIYFFMWHFFSSIEESERSSVMAGSSSPTEKSTGTVCNGDCFCRN